MGRRIFMSPSPGIGQNLWRVLGTRQETTRCRHVGRHRPHRQSARWAGIPRRASAPPLLTRWSSKSSPAWSSESRHGALVCRLTGGEANRRWFSGSHSVPWNNNNDANDNDNVNDNDNNNDNDNEVNENDNNNKITISCIFVGNIIVDHSDVKTSIDDQPSPPQPTKPPSPTEYLSSHIWSSPSTNFGVFSNANLCTYFALYIQHCACIPALGQCYLLYKWPEIKFILFFYCILSKN